MPPPLMANGHVQTIYPFIFRKIKELSYARSRINTADGDFLDLDCLDQDSKEVVILTHGLEGNSNSAYIKGMARHFSRRGSDVIAWNMRSCSGEMNRSHLFYHSANYNDLESVIQWARAKNQYKKIVLVSFSLGCNITAKYLGAMGHNIPAEIQACTLFSAPCCLDATVDSLKGPFGKVYLESFLVTMRKKIVAKSKIMELPGIDPTDLANINNIKTFRDFDKKFTAPLAGFKDHREYWKEASCYQDLGNIRIPTLIVNAKNDPFLNGKCYPTLIAAKNPYLHLEIPESGGHLGFVAFNQHDRYWSEQRASQFVSKNLGLVA
ncbi:MAG: alpha/beta fold hydrolase [Halobacteriovoraceae bacterium]|nr:alpha/beta fold hydrolase [Halobacteriovoraceae bacterium]MBT5094815.1 alpha/beta fold hydrolase [Halobacteriovoraceae bacterium]